MPFHNSRNHALVIVFTALGSLRFFHVPKIEKPIKERNFATIKGVKIASLKELSHIKSSWRIRNVHYVQGDLLSRRRKRYWWMNIFRDLFTFFFLNTPRTYYLASISNQTYAPNMYIYMSHYSRILGTDTLVSSLTKYPYYL